MKILVLCTGNSCRSQMAEAFLKSMNPSLEAYSAGTQPAGKVHPMAVQVMEESGISLKGAYPKNVDRFLNDSFDYVITVCDSARETCPIFIGKVKHRIHIPFEDPAGAKGGEEEVLSVFRRIRNEIKNRVEQFCAEIANEAG